MKSSFPGMDPYLEQHWRDVHARLIIYACDVLQSNLPDDLRARVEERVFVESPEGTERANYPNVRIIERPRRQTVISPEAGVAVAEPLVIHLASEPVSQGFIEIVEAGSGHRVITVIEVLSLANKVPGEGQDLYRQKQKELKEARVSLVEIDLLRAGQRVLSVFFHQIPPSHRTAYQVCVRRGWKSDQAEVYRVPLRERLRVIGVPLRETDKDIVLDLQALMNQCYERGRYDDLDYKVAPEPALGAEDAVWAGALLRGER